MVISIITLGWGYGFELFLLELIAIHYASPIKNFILKIMLPLLQLILFIVLYFTFGDQDINYGSQTLKHISFLFCFFMIAVKFVVLQDNNNISVIDIIATQKQNISYKNIAEIDYLTSLYNRAPMNEIIAKNFKMLSNKQITSMLSGKYPSFVQYVAIFRSASALSFASTFAGILVPLSNFKIPIYFFILIFPPVTSCRLLQVPFRCAL